VLKPDVYSHHRGATFPRFQLLRHYTNGYTNDRIRPSRQPLWRSSSTGRRSLDGYDFTRNTQAEEKSLREPPVRGDGLELVHFATARCSLAFGWPVLLP